MKIGFLILTHAYPAQVQKLAGALSILYKKPPILIHHDFDKCVLDRSSFGSNIDFVSPYFATSWGSISLVQAVMGGLAQLRAQSDPDWYYLLSGSDYPVASFEQVAAELQSNKYDAYIDHRRIDILSNVDEANSRSDNFDSSFYRTLAFDRYVGKTFPLPNFPDLRSRPARHRIHLRNPLLMRPWRFFTANYGCYAGEMWFSANRKAVGQLLEPTEKNKSLLARYTKRGTIIPDESYWHTIMANNHDLRLSQDNKRFIKWDDGAHPRTLNAQDVDEVLHSGAHFARKFGADSDAYPIIDDRLGI